MHRSPALMCLVAIWCALVGVIAPAQAQETATSVAIEASVEADGLLHVTQKVTFDQAPDQYTQTFNLTRPSVDYMVYRFEISELAVRSGGDEVPFESESDNGALTVKADTSGVSDGVVELSYDVRGAALAQGQTTQVVWPYLQGLPYPVQEVTGTIATKGAHVRDIQCDSGPVGAETSCTMFAAGTAEAPTPQFLDGPRAANEIVILGFTVPSDEVAPNEDVHELWTLDRAFSVKPLPLGIALGVLALGGIALYLLHRRFGADQAGTPIRIAEFTPIAAGEERFELRQDLRPGEVGTLFDERVDPLDITASIIDLAQRGHLLITELKREGEHASRDWIFERRDDSADELYEYEQILIDALVPEDGSAVKVSTISDAIPAVIDEVQEAIYDKVAANGWFVRRPDQARRLWTRLGVGGLIIAVLILVGLVSFTSFGLLGLALVGLACGGIWLAQSMPRRTAKGTSVLAGLQLLSIELRSQPTKNVPAADAYDEISRIIPYAIVLGGTQRWIEALVEADDDPGVPDPEDLSWYHAPSTWMLSDLPASLDELIVTLEGKLFTRN